jgi:CRISPR/Cas system CMR-associated protein Cmr5 small subunit
LGRAQFAWKSVTAVPGKEFADYRNAARALAALIRSSGLAAACAHLLTKGKGEQKLYEHLQEWLCDTSPVAPYGTQAPPERHRLLDRMLAGATVAYRHSNREALGLTVWIKSACESRAAAEEAQRTTGPQGSKPQK